MNAIISAILIVALAISAICGCELPKPEPVKPVAASESGNYGFERNIKIVEFRGHRYIVFSEGGYRAQGTAAVHDPDCPCTTQTQE